ncbi:RecB family exonuclease [Nakamurella sp. UYEF19]|uniref:PD-(D/E)XK nuclease family protein n=1 Tax=Nakamurella sp. UYEF19 TaxID=1756392 RepID=UPI003391D33B
MSLSKSRLITTAYGAPAIAALRSLMAELKSADPMAPVTLLVPNEIAGITARRALATGVTPGATGIAGLWISTLPRLAEQLAAASLSPRVPATRALVAAAWRTALNDNPGLFAGVKDHAATIRALTEAHRDLRNLDRDALEAVAASGALQHNLIDLHLAVASAVEATCYDEVELLHTAAQRIRDRPSTELGSLVLYLPQELSNAEIGLARELAERLGLTVLAGFAGEATADAAVLHTLEALGFHTGSTAPTAPTATAIRHASDSDDEVRVVVRKLIDSLTTTAPQRIAVLYGRAIPYARQLHEQLGAAGLLVNGPGTRAVDERAISRGFLGILGLGLELRRPELFRALAEAPVRNPAGTGMLPISRWERVSRFAAVVSGEDWDHRLTAYSDLQEAMIATEQAREDPIPSRIDEATRQIDSADGMRSFVLSLRSRLEQGLAQTTWPALAAWALDLFHDLYGEPSDLSNIPPDEQYSAVAIEQAIRAMSTLAIVESSADLPRLAELLSHELQSARPRVGRFGEGVFVGPVSAAVGLDLDVVYVVGLAEDTYPGRSHVDALLPDGVRDAVPQLSGSKDRVGQQLRQLLAAFAAAPQVVATFPRGDLRRSTLRLPSRWLLPSLRQLSGVEKLAATQWETGQSAAIVGSPSFAGSLLRTTRLATAQEWRIRAAGVGILRDQRVYAAASLIEQRQSPDFTRFDGNLTGSAGLPDFTAADRLVSPTQLESYAVCPHGYFMKRLLRVEPLEQPEELITISPLDIGNLIHQSIDEFVRGQAHSLPSFGVPWTEKQRAELVEIASRKASDFETRGLTGHPMLWAAERVRILSDLARMLRDDNEWRQGREAEVLTTELTFGSDGHPAVEVALPSGRVVRMRGSADKVDRARDGTLLVTDIKTGSPQKFSVLEKDPVAGGTLLQLPVYAHAARQSLGDSPVSAQYWFVRKGRGANGVPRRIVIELTSATESRYAKTLEVLVDGIAGGLFPAKAPEQADFSWVQCHYCNPDGIGHGEVRESWERKRGSTILADLLQLIDPEVTA